MDERIPQAISLENHLQPLGRQKRSQAEKRTHKIEQQSADLVSCI